MIPSDRSAEELGPPTPRTKIRGHQQLGRPYRRFDTLRSSNPPQPYFCCTLAFSPLVCLTAAYNIACVGGAVRSEGVQSLGRRPQDAKATPPVSLSLSRSFGQWAPSRGPADLSQNTLMAWGCYMPPPFCPSIPAASPAAADLPFVVASQASCGVSLLVRCIRA